MREETWTFKIVIVPSKNTAGRQGGCQAGRHARRQAGRQAGREEGRKAGRQDHFKLDRITGRQSGYIFIR